MDALVGSLPKLPKDTIVPCMRHGLLPFILLNLNLYLIRLGLELVTERLQFNRPSVLRFCAFALNFCEPETTLCLSHEVLDVLLEEHSVSLSITGCRSLSYRCVGCR